jgi:hypothetical protein
MFATQQAICTALFLTAAAADAPVEDGFPYPVYVAVENAEVVAGPGQRFYATDRLTRGTQVEVYREEASGWLAIRPPDGSFSWVPAEFIERSPDDRDVGRVKDATQAWIGTAAEQVSEHRPQVTLKTGELVQILGEKSVTGKSGQEIKWLKISPPAGEFRWIHLRDVSRQQPKVEPPARETDSTESHPGNEEPNTPTPALSQREREETEPRRLDVGERAMILRDIEPQPTRRDSRVEAAQFQSSTGGSESKSLSPDGFVPRKRKDGEPPRPATSGTSSSTTNSPAFGRPRSEALVATKSVSSPSLPRQIDSPAVTGGIGADATTRELEQIEVDLSLMLAKDKSVWDLASLEQRTRRLVDQGADPIARGRARLVLEKIKQFENAFNVADYGPITKGTGPAPATSETTKPVSGSLADPRYDAKGWLKPVVSRQKEKPVAEYAVVDQDGQPLCFITPSPGLNLHRYLNKQVGIYGRRGYLEELKKPHVVAERIIDLDRQWR